MPLRSLTTALLAAVAVFGLGACDTTDDTALDVFVVDFDLDTTDPAISDDGFVGSYTIDDVISGDDAADLADVLIDAGDGALVVAYIQSGVVFDVSTTSQTYSALPLTRGYERPIRIDDDGDGTFEDELVVDYIVTYEYSFDNSNFYFDVTSSARLDFANLLPATAGFRVVVIPDELFVVDGAGARVDLRDYEAVKAAYGLPD